MLSMRCPETKNAARGRAENVVIGKDRSRRELPPFTGQWKSPGEFAVS
jgi:hypothetical protein